jgi:N-acetylmuramoyl-L-alanine amidase
MRKIDYIFIHCSAGHGDLASVLRFWREVRKWNSPGYHKWVDYNGHITDIAPLVAVTNGVQGFNANAIHICYRGGVERGNVAKASDTRTPEQKQGIRFAIENILLSLSKHQDISKIRILGHRDISPDKNGNGIIEPWERIKECPSFDAIPEYSHLTTEIARNERKD